MEKRLLLAFVLSALIFAGWSVLFPPPPPPAARPQEDAVSREVSSEVESSPQARVDAVVPEERAQEEGAPEAVVGEHEQTIRLTNEVMEVELSNRGAVVTAMRLLGFDDDDERLDYQEIPMKTAEISKYKTGIIKLQVSLVSTTTAPVLKVVIPEDEM